MAVTTSAGTSIGIPSHAEESPEDKSFRAIQGFVLDEKKIKDSDVTSSFQHTEMKCIDSYKNFEECIKTGLSLGDEDNMLLEYREAPASPSASSVATSISTIDNLGSPPTPDGHEPMVDDERLPNELLDEIYEDAGLKEGMDLDIVEYLMENDADPTAYMTQEALMNAGVFAPSSTSTQNQSTSRFSQPSLFGSHISFLPTSQTLQLSSALNDQPSTTNSSGSSSPVQHSKRFHASHSGPTSPVRTVAPQTILNNGPVFKTPATPPTPKRSLSTQPISSPSVHSSSETCTSTPKKCDSPRTVCSDQDNASVSSIKQEPNSVAADEFNSNNSAPDCPQECLPDKSKSQTSDATHMINRLGKQVPPVVNVQTMAQHSKWMSTGQIHAQSGMMVNHANMPQNINGTNMVNSGQLNNMTRSLESPLDHGYFSGDSASVRSYESTTSNGTTISDRSQFSKPGVTYGSKGAIMNPFVSNTQRPMQKTVHFADSPNNGPPPIQRQSSCDMENYGNAYAAGMHDSNFDLVESEFRDNSQKSMQSKILPRLTHNMKSEVAPYTVPSSNGQMPMSPYSDFIRNNNNNNSINSSCMQSEIKMQNFEFNKMGGDMYGSVENLDQQAQCGFNVSDFPPSAPSNDMDPSVPFRPPGQSGMSQSDPFGGPMMGNNVQGNMGQGRMGQMNGSMGLPSPNPNSVNNSCAMMNQNRMITAHQGQMGPNYGPGFQNSQNVPGYIPPMQSPCGPNPRMMTMSSTPVPGHSGQIPSPMLDQSGFSRTPNMNVNPNVFQNPHMQGVPPGATPQGWNGNQNGANSQTPQQMQEMPHSVHVKTSQMNHMQSNMPPGGMPGTAGMPPCTQPNCISCKTGSPHRPPMMASQQTFIQHLITDRSSAFRSHPLFPLLRDLIIADMNFSSPSFPYQLISNLPADFDKLLQNFIQRNPPSGNYQTNHSVESVIMDALRYAHQCLIEKIRSKQEQEKHTSTSKSISAIEEFCEKFDRAVRNNMPGQTNNGNHNNMGMMPSHVPVSQTGQYPPKMMEPILTHGGFLASPLKKDLPLISNSNQFKSLKDVDDAASIMSAGSLQGNNKSESKKHPSLPKEAVAIMLDWLRNHKDNPYPNDDEKAMLIKQTGLTINQINYWFTNARRRILPKWAQCK